MSYRWVFADNPSDDLLKTLQSDLNVPRNIARLLSLRGVDNFEKARSFFRPDLSLLHDPFLMQDMEPASARLCQAIRNHETVVIYGDYDVDGTTATALMYLFLKRFGLEPHYYIPHRYKEGYGINPEGIEFAEQKGADLIVSVDCGITAIEEAKRAREKGIDLVICDHHTVGSEIPDAHAVLDPKRPDCTYPFDGLSGAGVAFKLIQAITSRLGLHQDIYTPYLDLVAISTASDIVPIVDENRILMREGLKIINTNPLPGIEELLQLIRMEKGQISTSNIVFSVGPRINAAGRMGDAATAVQLLISTDKEEAKRLAKDLEKINLRRRETDAKTTLQATKMVEEEYKLCDLSSMVLHHPNWHLGVIGIVASRLVDSFGRPAIMLSTVDGKIKGSARSIKGFNIYNALKECEDLLEQFGGHEFAAGLTIKKDCLAAFRTRMDEIAGKMLKEVDFSPELEIDDHLRIDEITARFWKLLHQFEPFGPGNRQPVFVADDVEVSMASIVGKNHLRLKVRQGMSGLFDAIGFHLGEFLPLVQNPTKRLSIAYEIEENHWMGRRSLQLRIKDIKESLPAQDSSEHPVS